MAGLALLLLSSLLLSQVHSSMILELIINVLLAKKLTQGVAFVCWENGNHDLMKTFSRNGIQAVIWNPRQEDTEILNYITPTWFQMFFVIDTSCKGSSTIMEILSQNHSTSCYHWLVLWGGRNTLPRDSSQVALPRLRRDCDVLVSLRSSANAFILLDAYSDVDNSTVKSPLGVWSPRTGSVQAVLPTDYKFSPQRRGDFKRKFLRATAAKANKHYTFTNLYQRTGFVPHDINIAVFLCIQQMFNFNIELYIDQNFTAGSMEVVNSLVLGTADIVPIVMGVLPERAEYIDYIHPISQLSPIIVFMQPPVSSLQNVFLLPFSYSTWFAILIFMLLTFLALRVCLIMLESRAKRHAPLWDTSETALLIFGMICQQCAARMPQSFSARVTVVAFLMPTVLLYTTFSGQVVSLLSTLDAPISSVTDLAQHKFKLGIDKLPYLEEYFHTSKDETILQLVSRKVIITYQSVMTEVLKGFTCYVSADFIINLMIDGITATERCKLTFFGLPHGKVPLAMAVANNSQYQEMFNWGSLKLYETGIVSRYNTLLEIRQLHCSAADYESLGLTGLYSVFVILASGMIAAIIFLLLEFAFHIRKVSKEIQQCRNQHKWHQTLAIVTVSSPHRQFQTVHNWGLP